MSAHRRRALGRGADSSSGPGLHSRDRLQPYGVRVEELRRRLAAESERPQDLGLGIEQETRVRANRITRQISDLLSRNASAELDVRRAHAAATATVQRLETAGRASAQSDEDWARLSAWFAAHVRWLDEIVDAILRSRGAAERSAHRLAHAEVTTARFAVGGSSWNSLRRTASDATAELARARSVHAAQVKILDRNLAMARSALAEEAALQALAARFFARLYGAPPAVLVAVRALLPAAERSDWWREVTSLLAETAGANRRRAVLSLLLHGPGTVWAAWRYADRPRGRTAEEADPDR
jgi:hypothetical protein